jgi:phosphotransferase system IIA component
MKVNEKEQIKMVDLVIPANLDYVDDGEYNPLHKAVVEHNLTKAQQTEMFGGKKKKLRGLTLKEAKNLK